MFEELNSQLDNGLCSGFVNIHWDPRAQKYVREPLPCKHRATMRFRDRWVCGKHWQSMQNQELKVGFLACVIEAKSAAKEPGEQPLSQRQVLALAEALAPLLKGKPFGG